MKPEVVAEGTETSCIVGFLLSSLWFSSFWEYLRASMIDVATAHLAYCRMANAMTTTTTTMIIIVLICSCFWLVLG